MKREWKLWASIFGSVVLLTGAVSIFGQQKPQQESKIMIRRAPAPDGPPGPPPENFVFIASEMNFDGKLVKAAPYSAQAVTESTQLLGDGNRIVNKTTATLYRDSEGRTRREHTLSMLGQFANAGDPPQTVAINDPVAGVNYALDPRTKVAHKMSPMRYEFKFSRPGDAPLGVPPSPDSPARIEMRHQMPPPPPEAGIGPGEPHPEVFMRHAPPPPPGGEGIVMHWQGERADKNVKKEELGKQTIEGVEAEGTRSTVTIPAGEIGNERPIEIISERWYSPELQTVVMTKHSDPRFGETTYRLTNISRSEPAKTLFEVPADYTIKENPVPAQHGDKVRMRRPGNEQ